MSGPCDFYPTDADKLARIAELRGYRAGLIDAIGSGVLKVAHGDKRTEFASVAEILKARNVIEEEIAALLACMGLGPVPGKMARRVTFIVDKAI